MYKTSDQFLQVNNIIDRLRVVSLILYATTSHTPIHPHPYALFFRIIGAKERLEQDFQQVL